MTETALVPKPADGAIVPRPASAGLGRMPTQIEKAAMILTAIGPEMASAFLRDLGEQDMERFAQTINRIGKISQDVLDAVIVEFLDQLTTGPDVSGGEKTARKLLQAVLDDESEIERLLQGRKRSEARSVWERLNWSTGPRLVDPDLSDEDRALEQLRALVEASAADALDRTDYRSVHADRHVSDHILDAAEGAGLLVVGSRGRGGFAGLLLGSVSQRCLEAAEIPVAIVRE